jgi:UDP-glucose 4-epimerase
VKILVTGAFGNVGCAFAKEVAGRGHDVVYFDLDTKANRKNAAKSGVPVVWGDITDAAAVRAAVTGRDAVVHLAAVIPPASIHRPDVAEKVNVRGTRNVIAACQAQPTPPRLAFASSVALFGPTQHLDPPRTLDDPINATDDYTRHKAECERMLHESGLDVAILRLGAVIPLDVFGVLDPLMFEVPLTDRLEFVHPWDVALAFIHAVESDEVWGRTFLIGGGPRCQIYEREIVNGPLEALGIGALPDEAFGTTPFQIDWLDTTESQKVLQYQRYDFDDCIGHMLERVGWRRPFVRLARPIARWRLLSVSPYYKAAKRSR